MLTIVLLAIVIALLFDFLNGMNDAANSIATIVATRVFSPRWLFAGQHSGTLPLSLFLE